VDHGAGYGLMLNKHNQTFLFHFDGAADDPVFYVELRLILRLPSFLPQPRGNVRLEGGGGRVGASRQT
jgi:hypothetical protein